HRGVECDRRQCERLLTAPQAGVRVAALDVGRTRPPPADNFQTQVVRRPAVLEGAAAVLEPALPLPQIVGDWTQCPETAARPPDVTARLEGNERTLTELEGGLQLTRRHQDVRETALREGPDVFESAAIGDLQGFAAVRDRLLRLTADEALEESGPVVPGRPARR